MITKPVPFTSGIVYEYWPETTK